MGTYMCRTSAIFPSTPACTAAILKSGPLLTAEFSSNPNQTHLSMLISVFKIIRKSQVGEFDQGWS